MKEEFLKISKKNAFKAFSSADKTGKKLLTDLFGSEVLSENITDSVRSYEDACESLGIEPLNLTAFVFVPEEDKVSTFAFHKLTIIARALNEGWKPNWADSSEGKYYPWFYPAGGSGFSFNDYVFDRTISTVGSRLVFRTRELAEFAGTQFTELYRQWMVIE